MISIFNNVSYTHHIQHRKENEMKNKIIVSKFISFFFCWCVCARLRRHHLRIECFTDIIFIDGIHVAGFV